MFGDTWGSGIHDVEPRTHKIARSGLGLVFESEGFTTDLLEVYPSMHRARTIIFHITLAITTH